MKTTVEIPEELLRRAKAKAALEGVHLRDLIVQGLQLAVELPPAQPHRAAFPLIKASPSSCQITDEDVANAVAVMDEEEAQRYASFVRR
jgi:hypothetical protein